MGIRFKFTLYISILLLFVIVGVSYTIFVAQKEFLTYQFSQSRMKTLKSFYSMCYQASKVKDDLQIHNAIKYLIKTYNPSVVYAGYVNQNNIVMYSSRDNNRNIDSEFRQRIKKVDTKLSNKYLSLSGENINEYCIPLNVSNKNTGTFIVGFSQDEMQKQIDAGISTMTSEIKKVAIVAIILGILIANFLGYRLSKPLNLLTKTAKQIADGNLDVEVSSNSKDEIGVLSQSFNNMAKQLKELDSMKDSFVSSVSHELRSPLSAIDGYCNLLIDNINKGSSKEQQLKGLNIIKQATIRLTNFINNILDLAKIKANKLEIKKVDADISAVINEIVSLFKPLALQQNKNIIYESVNQHVIVNIDIERIKQLVTNLIGNAMKFTKANGNIILTLFPESSGYGEDYLEVWVKDDGVGIPKSQVDMIFKKFFQVKDSEFKRPKGTGLGLTIVAEMIKLHNGYIWAESELGKGTVFKFVLPKN
ncbi:ATP-binding protein [Candidatus Ruminimicrobium bovinum]|uniref:HAMP domain-containing sensor histidine kinase n=1 Tax=Candidatus Ruminimicrobium bovinum TaxID=3242779 RepID=UPI0039B87AE9